MKRDNCPHCDVSLIGEPIAAEHLKHEPDHDEQVALYGRCYCLPYGDATHFRREIGHEVRGKYDGVLFWSCPDCHMTWNRWDFDGAPIGRRLAAESYVVEINEAILNAKELA